MTIDEKFLDELQRMGVLLSQKNADYGNSYEKLRDKYGAIAFHLRVADKLSRLEKVDKAGDVLVASETAMDTIRDIIGYSILELVYRKQRGGTPE